MANMTQEQLDALRPQIALAALMLAGAEAPEREVATCAVALRRALARALGERGVTGRALAAIPITATLDDFTFEESSQRYVVTYTPLRRRGDGDEPEAESIRTDRADGDPGVHDMMRALGAIGSRVIVYKTTEPMGDGSGRKVRVAPLVLPLEEEPRGATEA